MAKRDHDELFKILVIGDSAVGKSALLMRFTEDQFQENFISTIGIDFKAKVITIDGVRIKLQVWDTAGQERFRTITTAYFRSAVGILLVYDITNSDSFLNLGQWVKSIDMHASGEVVRLLVGNKSDLIDKRVVEKERGASLADEFGIQFFESSAKSGENVNELFQWLARKVLEHKTKGPSPPPAQSKDTVDFDKQQQQQKEGGCCSNTDTRKD